MRTKIEEYQMNAALHRKITLIFTLSLSAQLLAMDPRAPRRALTNSEEYSEVFSKASSEEYSESFSAASSEEYSEAFSTASSEEYSEAFNTASSEEYSEAFTMGGEEMSYITSVEEYEEILNQEEYGFFYLSHPVQTHNLVTALNSNTNLISLVLLFDENTVERQFILLFKALQNHKALTSLIIQMKTHRRSSMILTTNLATSLNELLLKNENLKTLQLNDLCVKHPSEITPATMLKNNHILTRLYLVSNLLGDEETKLLSDALKDNRTLTELALEDNLITPEGATHLASCLVTNNCLKILNLARNCIGNEGANHFAQKLKFNSCLKFLDLSSNLINNESADNLKELMSINRTLTTLRLSENQIDKEIKLELLRNFQLNSKREIYKKNIEEIVILLILIMTK